MVIDSRPSRQDHLDEGRISFKTIAGVETRCWEGGSGRPLILVHGGEFGDLYSLDSWSLNLEDLAKDFRVFAFDRLGQGFTGNPPDDNAYTIEAVMKHVTQFAESVPHPPVHLVGHSRGGFIVMRLALERPDLVETVTIVDSNTAAPENPELPSDRFYQKLEELVPGPPSADTVNIEPELQSHSCDHVTADFKRRLRRISRLPKIGEAFLGTSPTRQRTWLTGLDHLRRETQEKVRQQGIPVPAMVFWGYNDPSAPLSLGLDLFDLLCEKSGVASLNVINRAGHYSFREQPDVFNAAIRSFCLGAKDFHPKVD